MNMIVPNIAPNAVLATPTGTGAILLGLGAGWFVSALTLSASRPTAPTRRPAPQPTSAT